MQGVFSENPVPYFHDDRLRCRELPGSLCMNIDFMAMKTVVVAIFCAPHGKRPSIAIPFAPETIVRKIFIANFQAVSARF
ncbi:hypothetical protein [uncultured Parabacteroides sp.]|uniref:hypothetical protein n=1 Tax=uncultured Parabacteroides sp. TaxID=512312 RepID=UPI0026580211|nr:hypothetical protein [uncultured Parabacteroides sp.]